MKGPETGAHDLNTREENTMHNVIGLDLSLTNTGIARHDGTLEKPKYPKGVDGDRRLLHLKTSVKLAATGARLAVLEGYVTRSPAASSLGMVHGVVRVALMGMSVPYTVIPPATLKKFATGSGAATKADMRMEWFKRTGEDQPDEDKVDAAWCRQAGLHLLGDPGRLALPKSHTIALAKVALPTELAA
jgi:Holliday junction resolvasome RuvABC endonuclease subunit